jgi:hypothetical protein
MVVGDRVRVEGDPYFISLNDWFGTILAVLSSDCLVAPAPCYTDNQNEFVRLDRATVISEEEYCAAMALEAISK